MGGTGEVDENGRQMVERDGADRRRDVVFLTTNCGDVLREAEVERRNMTDDDFCEAERQD